MEGYIDFSDCRIDDRKYYGGANGKKVCVIYNRQPYMLKTSVLKDGEYTNTCVCEYLGSHIFSEIGFPTQETLLGSYNGVPVVACKDFEPVAMKFWEFAKIKNSTFDNKGNGNDTDLEEVLHTIRTQTVFPQNALEARFWDMFIIDAFLGNFDRHNGNWGFLEDMSTRGYSLSPVYDCGSCLYPRLTEKMMGAVLSDEKEIEKRIYEFPTSALKMEGKRISYFEQISSLRDEGCNEALARIVPKIDMSAITGIINNTPRLSKIEREFYTTLLSERKERILDLSLGKLQGV